ncbi:hypothetical protein C0993_002959 [Termitomyces sp. T159_Od127]|nr:hypothetical protein C0993_002959 [Termitomyces sp. T159_Od127]
MSTPTTDAFLAMTSFITHANVLLAQVQGLGAEAPCNKVPVVPFFDEELKALLVGKEPLVVSMAAKSKEAIIALLMEQDLQCQDKFWQEVAKESEADAQQCIANSLEALVWEELSLREAADADEELWQGQGEREGTKEKIPKTMANAAKEWQRQ